MIEKIKKEQLEARKNKDAFKRGVLTALLSDITAVAKNDGDRKVTDEDVFSVVKSFKNKAVETIGRLKEASADEAKIKEFEAEVEIYDSYLPKVLDEAQTREAIKKVVDSLDSPEMRNVMPALKREYGALLDMGLANRLVKEFL